MAFLKLTCEVQLRMSAGVPIKVVLDKPVFPWMEFPSQKTNSNRKGRHQIRVPTLNRHQIGSWDHRLEFLIGFPLHWRASAHSWTSGFTFPWCFYIMGHKQNFCWKWLRALFRDTVIISMSLSSCCFSLYRTREQSPTEQGISGGHLA